MFDLVALVVLTLAFARSLRIGFVLGVAAALAGISLIAGAGASAILSGAGEGDLTIPIGVMFAGPSAILHERSGMLAVFASPLAVALLVLLSSGFAASVASRRADELPPEGAPARALVGVAKAFVGASSLAGIRLVIVLMFRMLSPDG